MSENSSRSNDNDFGSHESEPNSSMFGRRLSHDVLRRYESCEEIAAVLEGALSNRAQTTLCGAQVSRPVSGWFEGVQGDKVSLRLAADAETQIGLRTLCTVIFTYNGHQCMFFSVILNVGKVDDSGFRNVALRLPSRIDEVEARWNRRTRLPQLMHAVAKVALPDGDVQVAHLLDLGRGGADIQMPEGGANELPFGTSMNIEIQVDGFVAELSGELRWRQGDRCGFCFSHFHDRQVMSVDPAFEKILKHIESHPDAEAA